MKVRPKSDTKECLASIPDFYLSMKHKVLDYPCVYFFTANIDETTGDITNVLFRHNIESSQLDRFEHNDGSKPGIPTYLFNDRILTLKNIITEETTKTFIEAIDVEKTNGKK